MEGEKQTTKASETTSTEATIEELHIALMDAIEKCEAQADSLIKTVQEKIEEAREVARKKLELTQNQK